MSDAVLDKKTYNDIHVVNFVLDAIQAQSGYKKSDLDLDLEIESDLGIDSIDIISIMHDLYKTFGIKKESSSAGISMIRDLVEDLSVNIRVENIDVSKALGQANSDSENNERKVSSEEFVNTSNISVSNIQNIDDNRGVEARTSNDVDPVLESIFSSLGVADDNSSLLESIGDENERNKFMVRLINEFDLPEELSLRACGTPKQVEKYIAAAQSATPINGEKGDVYDNRTMKDFGSIEDKDLFHKAREFTKFYSKKQSEELYWYGMPLESSCKNRAVIQDKITGKTKEYLMFASNNYLGLANDPRVLESVSNAVQQYGTTNTGCRLIGGSNVLHFELERKLAELKGREDCIIYPSGYSANLGAISALVGPKDMVFTDAINHMSIQDGCKLSNGSRKIYKHSLDNLEASLQRYADHPGGKLIVTDGVFSMHGDIVDLPRLSLIAKKYGARVLVDDAHSTGVLGKTGSGTTEHFDMKGEIDLELGTMSKALAGVGGFVCGDADVIEYLRFYSNSYVFAATIPACVAAGVITSVDIMQSEPERLTMLWNNISYISDILINEGFDLDGANSAIIPVVVRNDKKTLEFGRAVRKRGLFCQTVVYPGVAVGDARLRLSISSEHTREDLDLAATILVEAADEVGLARFQEVQKASM